MQIRTFLERDAPAVIALWTECLYNGAPHNDPESSLRRKLKVDPDLMFVAEIDGTVAGAVMGGYDGQRGWIYSLAVAPAFRKRGVGTALVRHVEAELASMGCVKINLQVRTANLAVLAFYEKLGYLTDDVVSLGKLM